MNYNDNQVFFPSSKVHFWDMLRSEFLMRLFNKTPLWMIKTRNRILKGWIGDIKGGSPYSIFSPFYASYGKNIKMGEHFFSNINCLIMDYEKVSIGDNVWLGPNVSILTVSHPMEAEDRRVAYFQDSFEPNKRGNKEIVAPITIGDDVWIAAGSVICAGVTIGNRSVIGAGSIVTRDIPDGVFACGVPAKVIRKIG
jgi:maltose O-acetyltransferase